MKDAEAAREAADKITAADYTAATYKAVEEARKAFEEAMESGDIEAIKSATTTLNDAVAAAQLKSAASITKVTPLSKTYKKKKVKKKAQTFTLKATVSSKARATFTKTSGNNKITVAKTGKVTVKKGLKKGKYTVKVKVSAPATDNYKTATKTVSVKIRVK